MAMGVARPGRRECLSLSGQQSYSYLLIEPDIRICRSGSDEDDAYVFSLLSQLGSIFST